MQLSHVESAFNQVTEKTFQYPTKESFKKMLKDVGHEELVRKFLLCAETPYAFRNKRNGYQYLVNTIAQALGIANTAVTLVGSARIGFSLDPDKYGKPFSKNSDLDFAIIDSVLFDTAWLELISLGPRKREVYTRSTLS